MDEFLEFDRNKIEALRKPLEEKSIVMIRRGMKYVYPADVIFIAASNPCKCGYFGDSEKECRCTPYELEAYRSKLSGPLADRIDMAVSIQRVHYDDLSEAQSDDSRAMKEKVMRALDAQERRFRGTGIKRNALMNENQVREFCPIGREERAFLEKIYRKFSLSPRRYYKLLLHLLQYQHHIRYEINQILIILLSLYHHPQSKVLTIYRPHII
jgi:magnesium chelatase family protein